MVNATFRMWSDINSTYREADRKLSLLNDDATPFRDEELTLLRRVSKVYRWTAKQELVAAVAGATLP